MDNYVPEYTPELLKVINTQLQKALAEAIPAELLQDHDVSSRHLYLTKEQYAIDPEGWKTISNGAGLPEENIVIVDNSEGGDD